MMYGKLPALIPALLGDIREYFLGRQLPVAPPSVAVPAVSAWGMLGNDTYGDCGPAGLIHGAMADASMTKEAVPDVPTDEVVAAYLAYTGGQDSGVALSQFLAYVRQGGFCGQHIEAYAPSDVHDVHSLRSIVDLFGFAYTGIVVYEGMEAACQGDSSEWQPWTTAMASGAVAGGHCVPIVGYDDSWLYLVTWGQVQRLSWPAWHEIADECWAPVTGELLSAGGDDRGFGYSELTADLDRIADAGGSSAVS